jgi:hypothetical protein
MLLDNVHKMVDGGLSLQPYVHPDCGAHYGVPFEQETPEMFVRWAQFCAMGTIIRFHTNNCCDHRPWTWGTEAEDAIRKILKLRYTLMPTLIAAGRRATADGTPVVQRLDLTWPELADEGANRNDQYLFADGGMLVAPIIPFNGSDAVAKHPTNGTGNASRTVWIPPGSWQDAWASSSGGSGGGQVVVGPKMIEVKDCPLDRIPMWHKKGSVLITAPHQQHHQHQHQEHQQQSEHQQQHGEGQPTVALSTKEQSWDELALEIFPFPIDQQHDTTATAEAGLGVQQALRSYTAHLHDTKAAHTQAEEQEDEDEEQELPPRTDVRLDQHPTSGVTSLHISAEPSSQQKRTWKLRVHLLPGERLTKAGVTVTTTAGGRERESRLPITQTPLFTAAAGVGTVVGAAVESHALIAPMSTAVHDAGAAAASQQQQQQGRVVEAVVVATPGHAHSVKFEVAAY